MGATNQTGRTYNQNHVPRPYTAGRRRFSIYWTWSYPWECNRDTTELDNRFSTMTEVRRVAWPSFEKPEWDRMNFLQGIAGTLELFHRSTLAFQQVVGEATGHPAAVYQRIDQAGYRLPIDETVLADTDTLMVFGLDHLVSEQEAEQGEIDAIRTWLNREGTCLLLAPHHDVGFTDDMKQRQMEYKHHGDELVPRQQRFGQYTRSLMQGLGVPVLNQFGLRPAVVPGTDQIAPLTTTKDLDELGLLNGVTTFNFHLHLPHYALTTEDTNSVRVLARQPIDLSRPHPFTAAGNREFNSFLWMPPQGGRGGDILLADSTIFTTLFGGTDSLGHFWRNMANLRVGV
ncbi:hypothetical protein [Paludisphaera borealis]|uniref:hypothetical protein n=1 Tax=Paludisphaera borealis TaxID=1387353 RepID=UPI00285287B5|nr:hypothetical protein [Paludisphaera borealis]